MDISNISTIPSIDMLVSQYMMIESQPITQLQQQKSDINLVKSVFTDLKSKLTSLRSIASDFKTIGENSKFGVKSVTSADETILTANANGNAVNGSHLVQIQQLAKADTIVSNQIASTGSTIFSAEGTGTKTFKITINGEETDINVEISNGEDDNTILTNIASAINNSDAEVAASVINDSQGTNKLVLRSDSTGSTYGISLNDVSGTLLSTIGLNDSVQATDTTGGYIYADSELNAIFELDGITITNDSNTVDDVLTGVTLNLSGTQESSDDPIQITIEPDKDAIKENLNDFFEKYNEVINFIREKINVDPDNNTRGALAGDFTFINLRMNLRTLASNIVSSVQSGSPSRISEIGIEPDNNGNLSIDDVDDLYDALDANVSNVEDLFNSTNGIAVQIYDLLTPFTRTGGIIDDDTNILDERIESIDDRIENLEKRLEWKEQNYRQQFTKLQEAYVALSIQQNILSVISSSFASIF